MRDSARGLPDRRGRPLRGWLPAGCSNLLLLVVVPVVFVVVAAGSLSDAADLLGGASRGEQVPTATAGWAVAFLAGTAMYFQTSSARDADRRLVIAALSTARLVAARLAAGLVLAALASAAALAALAARTGIQSPGRVLAGTLMFAVIYLAVGAVVGAWVRNPVNGMVLILFVWILDVFFGPVIGPQDSLATRALPTHFVSLWMVDLPSRHGGRIGDLGWALVWTVGAVVVAWTVVAARIRVGHRRRQPRPGSIGDQLRASVRMGLRDGRRNPALWVLLAVVPAVFILLAKATTPDRITALRLTEHGRASVQVFNLADIHAGTMAPIAATSLAVLGGLFIALDTRTGDRRLALAGLRPGVLLAARLAVVALAAALATAVSLAVTAIVFDARQWPGYVAANALLAATYGLLGVLLAPVFGRVAGVFVAFLVPFLDIGLVQSPMLRDQPAAWAAYVPGYGGSRVLIDTALTPGFDQIRPLLIGLAWLAGLAVAVTMLFRRVTRPASAAGRSRRSSG